MFDHTHAMISIRPEFVSGIIAGTKTVEVRRSIVRLPVGSTLWVYSTLPVGAIVATATLSHVEYDSPNKLWTKFRHSVGILKENFDQYFNNCPLGTAIILSNVEEIIPIPLDEIREIRGKKVIPQVLVKVSKSEAIRFSSYEGE